MKFRKEFDSLGNISVPSDKYWGASTQRSRKFFNIGSILVKPTLIKSIAIAPTENTSRELSNIQPAHLRAFVCVLFILRIFHTRHNTVAFTVSQTINILGHFLWHDLNSIPSLVIGNRNTVISFGR